MNKIFLGGTCAESKWRDDLIKVLDVDFFNPVVEDWTSECQIEEENQKTNHCNIHLYVITSQMEGVFSIAEVIESAHMGNKHTVLQVIPYGFTKGQLKSLEAVVNMVRKHSGVAYVDEDLMRTARVLNYSYK